MKRSGRSATRSTMSGRSTRSALSTSIRRRPCGANSFRQALISELLPVPRAPVSSTLLAPWPATNCSVLRSSRSFCGSTSTRSARRIVATWRTGSMRARAAALAVAEGDRRAPVGRGQRLRQHGLQAREQRFGARDQAIRGAADSCRQCRARAAPAAAARASSATTNTRSPGRGRSACMPVKAPKAGSTPTSVAEVEARQAQPVGARGRRALTHGCRWPAST